MAKQSTTEQPLARTGRGRGRRRQSESGGDDWRSLAESGDMEEFQAAFAAAPAATDIADAPPAEALARRAPSFDELRAEYVSLWSEMALRRERLPEIDHIVETILANKAKYQTVEGTTGVAWYVVALIHSLEGSLNFRTHLHNGDPLSARTVHVPRGRPVRGNPPFTWEESAEDALVYDGLAANHDWSIAKIAYLLERFNGMGYRLNHPEVKSPYLWSFSNLYERGKYVADGSWSPTAVSGQCGAMVLLRQLAERDSTIRLSVQGPAAAGAGQPATLFAAADGTGNLPPWVAIARGELGQRDYPGPRYNPRVAEYLHTTGLETNSDETSWCSAFVNWCMIKANLPGTNNAGARSWLDYGEPLSEPRPGCITVLWRESPQSWKGHVGFFEGWDPGNRVRLLAGNQGGGVDWDEVCVTNFPKERILAFRWPRGV